MEKAKKLTVAERAAGMRATFTFEEALSVQERISDILAKADAAVEAFAAPYGKGPMGLTPEACRTNPEYRALKAKADAMFKEFRYFNQIFNAAFKKEYRAHVMARREAKMLANRAKSGD